MMFKSVIKSVGWLFVFVILSACGGDEGRNGDEVDADVVDIVADNNDVEIDVEGDVLIGVDEDIDNIQKSRHFFMGFTPWIYNADSWDYFLDTYKRINENGDIVAHHLMTGIPWQEALDKSSYHKNVEGDISDRLKNTESDKKIYLAVDCLNAGRDDLVGYWAESFSEPISSHKPWDKRSFDSPEVIEAYSNFAIDMIERFSPAYFNYATEISELILNNPDKFKKFKVFAEKVSENIRKIYPDLPLLVSVAFKNPASDQTKLIKEKMAEISDYYDILGVSTYGYIFFDLLSAGGNPENLPADWFSQALTIAGEKPLAVTETAWLAEDFPLGEPYSFTIEANKDFQDQYLQKLLGESEKMDVRFIIWFSIVDYDAWDEKYGDFVTRIWRDTGLYDENLEQRPALETWQNSLAIPFSPR